ncbi:MAG: bifunctional folylpolyglutamate synthase/dihydrofolate synthase [Desulfobacteraceae bacterium]|nr:bifunctional folylpolyglutamate synthase/dihydrofolate synthase [Desulfobacteraceae bacterium]
MASNEYKDCLEKMFRLHRFGIKLGLDTIRAMLAALGNPQDHFQCIHIAGTNGKGSVAAMLSTILKTAGYKVGRYTSPHLESFNERICINDEPIDDACVVRSCQRSMAVQGLERQPTFFEFTTAMALDEFSRHQVQWAVIETGMGGRLDATNILTPALSIITNISLEHRNYLGRDIATIAGEKAGIIKPGVPVITGVHQQAARKAIERQALVNQATVYWYGKEFRSRRASTGRFHYNGVRNSWRGLQLGLIGDHQIENTSLVLAACEQLMAQGSVNLTEDHIRSGIKNTRWPGRLEVVLSEPLVILDGAHNLMSARVLGRHLSRYYNNRKITLVVGILDDKPYRNILKDLLAPCHRVIITQPKIDRAIPAPRLASVAATLHPQIEIKEDVGAALIHALTTCGNDEVICVAGSLYVVGEAKTALREWRTRSTDQ